MTAMPPVPTDPASLRADATLRVRSAATLLPAMLTGEWPSRSSDVADVAALLAQAADALAAAEEREAS